MALYIPHSIFHLARLLYVRPETFGPSVASDDTRQKYAGMEISGVMICTSITDFQSHTGDLDLAFFS